MQNNNNNNNYPTPNGGGSQNKSNNSTQNKNNQNSENKNVAEIIVAKNRHGETGSVNLQWMGQFTTFSSQERIHTGG